MKKEILKISHKKYEVISVLFQHDTICSVLNAYKQDSHAKACFLVKLWMQISKKIEVNWISVFEF